MVLLTLSNPALSFHAAALSCHIFFASKTHPKVKMLIRAKQEAVHLYIKENTLPIRANLFVGMRLRNSY
jgi:hypothetical protein